MGMLVNPFRYAVGGYAPPGGVSGLSGWYDFTDASTIFADNPATTLATVGGTIGHIADKSGNGRNLVQDSAGSRPTMRSGYAEFRGTGNTRHMQHTSSHPVGTAFCVVNLPTGLNAGNGYAGLLSAFTSVASGAGLIWVRDNNNNAWFMGGQALGVNLSDASHMWKNRVLTTAWTTGSKVLLVADGTGHANPVFPNGMKLCNDRGIAARYLEADVYEILTYTSILSSGDRATVESYLGTKHGITLP